MHTTLHYIFLTFLFFVVLRSNTNHPRFYLLILLFYLVVLFVVTIVVAVILPNPRHTVLNKSFILEIITS